ncbi:rhodanese-like domain-containing protein [Paenibacillus sp. D51F]
MSAEITTEELQHLLETGETPRLFDVREDDEWEAGHIPQARHVALSRLPDSLGELDGEGPLLLICRSGGRSSRACEYLQALGYDVVNVQGGMLAWNGSIVEGE